MDIRISARFVNLPMVLLAAALAAWPAAALASPESQKLIDEGVRQLGQENLTAALQTFNAAAKADPADAAAVYYQGAALNRLGRHDEALPKLQAAEKQGLKKPGLDFEIGWALLRAGRLDEAVRRLKAYEEAKPGAAMTSELLGQAYTSLGYLDDAEAMFKQALKRNPRLEPNVRAELAIVERLRGNKAGESQQLRRLLHEYPNSPVSQALSMKLPREPAEAPPEKPWRLNFMLGTGYNSNVLTVGDSGLPGGAPLPADIRRDGSAFATLGFGASYELVRTDTDALTVGYTLQSDLHGEHDTHTGDLLENYWFVEYDHRLDEDTVVALLVADDYNRVGREDFSNNVYVRPSIAHRFCEAFVGEAAYIYQRSEFLFGPPMMSKQDRDSNNHTLALTGYARVPGTDLTGRFGYYHTYTRADGSDFDSDADAVFIYGAHPLPCQVNLEVGYTRIWNDYHDRNSVAGPFAWAFAREDNIHVFTVEFTRPLGKGVTLFLRYQGLWNGSNIPEYDFKQHLYTGGVLLEL